MDANDIKIQAYGPLSSIVRAPGGPVDDVVKRIAEGKGEGVTEAQVLLAWAYQYGGGCVVTYVSPCVFLLAHSKESEGVMSVRNNRRSGENQPMPMLTRRTSRTPSRQLEQLESLSKVQLTQQELEDIAQAGKGMFKRVFMHKAWDNAKP
jgi:hypothetical protein